MTNIFGTADKRKLKRELFNIGIQTLEKHGWRIERAGGGSSVRKITKDGRSKRVTIRTTQDTYIAFPRNRQDDGWTTLSDVDLVVAVSVNDQHTPKYAKVHLLDAEEMRGRFDRTYKARKKAGYTIPLGRGIWLSLYLDEANEPPTLVGAGAGLKTPAIAEVPLSKEALDDEEIDDETESDSDNPSSEDHPTKNTETAANEPLTIPEAKRRLALTLGVPASSIKISIEG